MQSNVKSKLPDYFIPPNKPSKCTWGQPNAKNPHFDRSHQANPLISPDILCAIGNTPMVRLNKIPQSEGIKCEMYVKCEFLNPGGSVKDRIGYRMIQDAEDQGHLTPGCTIIEPSSGNTGIGVAIACAVKGYKCVIVMPEKMSTEKSDTLKVLGATIIRTPNEAGFDSPEGLICVAQRLNQEIAGSVIMGQYSNSSNPLAHYDGTAEEILRQCDGKVDMIVCGAGTGGSVSGIGRKFRERCPECVIVSADPEGSILAAPEALNKSDVKFFEVEGLGYDFIPTVLDRDIVDVWYKSNDRESFPLARRLIREEGILSGASSGSAIAVALKAAKTLKEGQKCVVILPDGIRNYMTKFVSDNWMEARHFKEIQNEFNHWWWEHKVGELELPAENSQSVKASTTCQEALRVMRKYHLDQVNVIDDKGTLLGVITSEMLTKKVVSMNLQLKTPVEYAVFKKFIKVKDDTVLGFVSRMLETDTFVIIDGSNTAITRMDLLTFISNGPDGRNSGITNGVKTMKVNGFSNGAKINGE